MQPFLIWFQQRSGSSHLVSLLNSHPEIRCKGEVFGCYPVGKTGEEGSHPTARHLGDNLYRRRINQFPGRIEDPNDKQCLDEVVSLMSHAASGDSNQNALGFKMKFPSQATLFPEVRQHLESMHESLKVIVLTRKNYLHRAISNLNLDRLQSLTTRSNVEEAVQLPPQDFDAKEVVRLIDYYKTLETDFFAWPARFKFRLEIDYDDLVSENVEQTADELLLFLDVNRDVRLSSKLKKVAPSRLETLVNNAQELKDALKENKIEYKW